MFANRLKVEYRKIRCLHRNGATVTEISEFDTAFFIYGKVVQNQFAAVFKMIFS